METAEFIAVIAAGVLGIAGAFMIHTGLGMIAIAGVVIFLVAIPQ